MHLVWPMTAVVLFISFFNNGNVKGNNLETQVSQMLQEMIHLKEHLEFLQKDILNNVDLMKLNGMQQGLAQEKVNRFNLGKKIDSMEKTLMQNLATIENIERHIENRLLAKINTNEVTFRTTLEEKVNKIEQKFEESIINIETSIENKLIANINYSEVASHTKLEEKLNTIEQKFKESIGNTEKHLENRLLAMINGSEVAFETKLEEKVSTIEQKFKERIGISEKLTENRLIARINSSEEPFGTKLGEKMNTIEQKFKKRIQNTEKHIENRLLARINASKETFGSELKNKVSTIEQKFKESIDKFEQFTENRLIARINASEETFGIKLEEKVNSVEQKFKESIENIEKLIENRLTATINVSEVTFGTKLEEKFSMMEQKFKQSIGTSEKLTENRLIARINASEVAFGIKLQDQVNTTEQKFKGSMSKLNQTLGYLSEQINQWRVEQQDKHTINCVVGFAAELYPYQEYQPWKTIAFDKVLENQGGGYNSNTGVFRAPCKGMYLFSVTIQVPPRLQVHLELMKSSSSIGMVAAGYGSDSLGDSSSVSVLTTMNKNEEVYVKTTATAMIYGNQYSIFMGVLISSF